MTGTIGWKTTISLVYQYPGRCANFFSKILSDVFFLGAVTAFCIWFHTKTVNYFEKKTYKAKKIKNAPSSRKTTPRMMFIVVPFAVVSSTVSVIFSGL